MCLCWMLLDPRESCSLDVFLRNKPNDVSRKQCQELRGENEGEFFPSSVRSERIWVCALAYTMQGDPFAALAALFSMYEICNLAL